MHTHTYKRKEKKQSNAPKAEHVGSASTSVDVHWIWKGKLLIFLALGPNA
jgi:hypothetical protein